MSLIEVPRSHTSSTSRPYRSKSQGTSPRFKPKQKKYVPDPIDKLDTTSFGGYYHHGGPYDAARPSFNINPKYSPLAATKHGNKAAWEATPREAQLDAIMKGRPLDGVGIVPPGQKSMSGEVMNYEEGADMMRDNDPGGGAYKRWPGIQYHPDDLKGKGEPGYSIDLKRKAAEAAAASGRPRRSQSVRNNGNFELDDMAPRSGRRASDQSQSKGGANPVSVRHRSSSASSVVASGSRPAKVPLKEGLKRRFGSLKRK